MVIHNPFPSSMRNECKKAGQILASFVDPRQTIGPDKVIPPSILAHAKGLAILTVFKVGFLGGVRMGSGVVVARLADGTWSAPSAIMAAGGSLGGQLGFELTDFVFILNDAAAVRTFSKAGAITLGGNVSIAAGPVGRNAEAAGAASLKSVAAIFSYSKTKGLFAGVSLEGSMLVERKDANQKMYNGPVTASELLEGNVPPPPAAEPLMRILASRVFAGVPSSNHGTDMYNDMPVYDDRLDDVIWEGRRSDRRGESAQRSRTNRSANPAPAFRDHQQQQQQPRRSTWAEDGNQQSSNIHGPSNRPATFGGGDPPFGGRSRFGDDYVYSDSKPSRPTAPKPIFKEKPTARGLAANQALALFNFDADQPGDLGFRKGDIITIVKRTNSRNDWWTGRIGEKQGIFPR
ncbi:MAG: hypothetical protein M1816_007485 [Peltula sp. TS41687]|nr:MAG: hypothetical protein M1816_007485 [Peltula sp. TS41687]